MSAYEADYNEMKESFIYGQSLDFGELMKRITKLQEKFGAKNLRIRYLTETFGFAKHHN